MTIHLFQRTLTKNGKKIKAWYYWYYDEFGKQVRKSCGQAGKPCILKRDAEAFIANLKEEELKKEKITFADYCKGFYDLDSRFLKKQAARGYNYQPNSIYQKNLYLQKFLLAFGKINVRNLTVGMVENWLIDLDCSNSVKNNILSTVEEIESELYSDGLIDNPIHVKHFKRNTKDKGILSLTEITKLFPVEYDKLIETWRIRSTERENDIYSFAAAIYTLLITGMRSSEIRALQWNQFIRPDAILINAMIDSNDNRVNRLKKWSEDNKKWRVTVLPDRTVKMIEVLRLDKSAEDYVFMVMDKPLTTWFLLEHFKCVLEKNGINCKERNITIHSLRFTYNSLMKGEISGDDLRLMVGHTSEVMTEYYDKSKALEHLDTLLLNKSTLNNVFN
ncbi:MAG: tyrosine-type recombinase/integrase [Methanobrevibacter sp.]|nr:tyrosine-type recombinase/integrase [Methanobrevibacter sp.]